MKKIDTESLEKMAKQKNIDKDKIEKIADSYKGKSESELMDELVKIGKTLEGRDEVVSKFKTFLDENQRKKLDIIMGKISDAEIQSKIESKKAKSNKQAKGSISQPNDNKKTSKISKQEKTKSPKHNHKSSVDAPQGSTSNKKVKKVVKKVKRPNSDN